MVSANNLIFEIDQPISSNLIRSLPASTYPENFDNFKAKYSAKIYFDKTSCQYVKILSTSRSVGLFSRLLICLDETLLSFRKRKKLHIASTVTSSGNYSRNDFVSLRFQLFSSNNPVYNCWNSMKFKWAKKLNFSHSCLSSYIKSFPSSTIFWNDSCGNSANNSSIWLIYVIVYPCLS